MTPDVFQKFKEGSYRVPASNLESAYHIDTFNKTIMGFDTSLTNTGVAVLCQGFMHWFSISGEKYGKGAVRLYNLYLEYGYYLDKYKPDLVAMEGYSFASKFSRPHSLGEAGGALKLAAASRNIKLVSVPPMSMKLWLTGKGNAKKDQVVKALKDNHFNVSQKDEADAVAVSLCGYALECGNDEHGLPVPFLGSTAKLRAGMAVELLPR